MCRRIVLLCALLALVPAAPAAAAKPAPPPRSWAQPQIAAVAAQGILGTDPATFRPDDPLTRGAATALVAGLTHQTPPAAVANAAASVTIAGLDARLVGALALQRTAAQFLLGARAAGLAPPSRFGTEVTARLLGLRTNHPASQDDLELLPNDPATRAEAAYSAARILKFSGWEAQSVQAQAATFTLPPLTPWQQRVLATAVSFIGFPYVWGGTSESAEAPFGVDARGGFDCSGFVWRVYKLQPYPGASRLAATLRGRTTFQMSGEVPRAQRVPLAQLQPADVLFFGAKGPRSKPAEVDHTGIYLGNGWFIHSSGYGVAVAQLAGWYHDRFAWARRPLAEAGLAATH
jgi:cell wall-associated NlpC family hydrolase